MNLLNAATKNCDLEIIQIILPKNDIDVNEKMQIIQKQMFFIQF